MTPFASALLFARNISQPNAPELGKLPTSVTGKAVKDADEKATIRTRKSTMLEDIYEPLEEHGEIPLDLKEALEKIEDIELLKKYL